MEIKSLNDWNILLLQAENGEVEAMNDVAMHLRDGLSINNIEIVQVDKMQSFNWTKKAYEQGDFYAMEAYADYLTEKENGVCEVNFELGKELYEKCIINGSSRAMFNLGLTYRNKQQFDKAFKCYEIAHRSEEFYKELTIGLCYYYGLGVIKDKLKALKIFEIIDFPNVCAYEMDETNYLIGKIYLEGEVVEQDIQKARYYLELANCDDDHRSAQELLIIIGRSKLLN